MKLFFEKIYPYLFGLIAAAFWFQAEAVFPTGESLLSATLTVSGIFVGFLATSKSILISMSSPIIDQLKRSGYIEELVSYIGQAIWVNLFFCSLSVVGYFVDTHSGWYSLIWVGASVCALSAFIRVTHIMLKIFKYG
ncbi:hypothetical protein ACFQNJ_05300 [Hydrogenophaga bisanensis]|uniref:Uncharacterized protein n=1 Tax=Hydrogenophaga bisanensis TaxID=439611 RepID=A0ABW2R776_9BURK